MTFAQPFSGYEILARVGAGAMGTVFRARQKHMNRIVALKVLKPSLARNEKYVERLRREARIVGQLNHPNIVTGYDLGEEGGYHFFVMEFVEGQSLRELQAEWGWFPEERVLDVGIQVAEALDHAFRAGVIHRDVKPGNILIDEQGHAKLTDMGLAKGPTDLTLTRDGATVGTPQFLSPEQARDPRTVDIRGDLYSLGATLYQMSTGVAPFSADTIGELIHQVLHDYPPDARAINPQLSEGMGLVIKKLLMKEPALRYQTPRELLDDLKRVQRAEHPIVDVRRLERAERRAAPLRSRRSVWIAAAAIAVVAVSTAVWWRLSQPRVAVPGEPTGSAQAAFESSLRARLDEAGGVRNRLAALADYRARADGSIEHAIVDRYSGPIYQRIADSVASVLRGCREWLGSVEGEQFLNDASNWRAVDRSLRERCGTALFDACGLHPSGLPAGPREIWDNGVETLERSIRGRAEERDRLYAQAFESYLAEDLEREVNASLLVDEFEEARRKVRRGVEHFHGRDGRPALGQVDESLRKRLTESAEVAVAELRDAIDLQERRLVRMIRAEVDSEIASLREDLARSEDPRPLARRLESFRRRRLGDTHPSSASFRDSIDPWPQVEVELSRLSREIDEQIERLRIAELRDTLSFTYRVVAGSGLDEAFEFLEDQVARSDVPEGGAHLETFAAARVARDAVLARLVEGVTTRDVPIRRGQVRVTRAASDGGAQGFVLADADTEVSLPFAVVAGELLRHVDAPLLLRGASDEDEMRAGLAFWHLFAAEEGKGLALLREDDRRDFLTSRVAPLVRECAVRPLGSREDGVVDLLLRLRRARERERAADVRELLEEFQGLSPADLDAAGERQVRAAEQWLVELEQRSQRLRQLVEAAPAGARVAVGENGSESVLLDPQAIHGVGLHGAWTIRDGALWMLDSSSNLQEAEARRIDLPSVVSAANGLECAFDVRFEPTGSRPRLVVLSCLGVSCALVVLPNGLALGDMIDLPTVRGAAGDLRRTLGDLIATSPEAMDIGDAAAWVTSGAVSRVRLEIAGSGRTHARLWIDDRLIFERRVHVSADAPGRVQWMPFQPVALLGIQLRVASPQ